MKLYFKSLFIALLATLILQAILFPYVSILDNQLVIGILAFTFWSFCILTLFLGWLSNDSSEEMKLEQIRKYLENSTIICSMCDEKITSKVIKMDKNGCEIIIDPSMHHVDCSSHPHNRKDF